MDFPPDVFILNSVKDLGNVIYIPLKTSEIPPAPLETPWAWVAAEPGRDIVSWRIYSLAEIPETLQLHLYRLLRNMKYDTVTAVTVDGFLMPVVNIILGSLEAEWVQPLLMAARTHTQVLWRFGIPVFFKPEPPE